MTTTATTKTVRKPRGRVVKKVATTSEVPSTEKVVTEDVPTTEGSSTSSTTTKKVRTRPRKVAKPSEAQDVPKTSEVKPKPKKVTPAKKVPRKPVKKTTTRKTKPVAGTKNQNPVPVRPLNDMGFVEGSDSGIIAATLVAGGKDRLDVNAKIEANIAEASGLKNRNGGDKYIPSITSGVLRRMLNSGKWQIEATWKLVPADNAPVTKVAKDVATEPEAPEAPTTATPAKVVKKRPRRRVTKS